MHDSPAHKCSCLSFQTSSSFTPAPHTLARWSHFCKPANIWHQGSFFWQLVLIFSLPLCRDVRFESWNGRYMVITVSELTGHLGKLTKLVRIQVDKDHKLQPKFASWHGWYMVITCNQMPSSCSNRLLLHSRHPHSQFVTRVIFNYHKQDLWGNTLWNIIGVGCWEQS